MVLESLGFFVVLIFDLFFHSEDSLPMSPRYLLWSLGWAWKCNIPVWASGALAFIVSLIASNPESTLGIWNIGFYHCIKRQKFIPVPEDLGHKGPAQSEAKSISLIRSLLIVSLQICSMTLVICQCFLWFSDYSMMVGSSEQQWYDSCLITEILLLRRIHSLVSFRKQCMNCDSCLLEKYWEQYLTQRDLANEVYVVAFGKLSLSHGQ